MNYEDKRQLASLLAKHYTDSMDFEDLYEAVWEMNYEAFINMSDKDIQDEFTELKNSGDLQT